MKKLLIIIAVILFFLFSVDFLLAKMNKAPFFSIPVRSYDDGGSTEYYGLSGYKIIKYVDITVDGIDIRVDFGHWRMPFEKEK